MNIGKRIVFSITILVVIFLNLGEMCFASTSETMNRMSSQTRVTSKLDEYTFIQGRGYVDVLINMDNHLNKKVKILIRTPNGEKKWYTPKESDQVSFNKVWLTWGKGRYIISIMENLTDRSYKYITSKQVINQNYIEPYIFPSSDVQSDNEEIILLSNSLISNVLSDLEKATLIYKWVSQNIEYDFDKVDNLNNTSYKYGAIETLKLKKGTCYDFSTLVAAIGRASGLKVKVVNGILISRNKKVNHVWNEVYISEIDKWISIDTTMAFYNKKLYFNNLDTYSMYNKYKEF